MKLKKVLSVALVAVMTMSMAACGGSNNAADNGGATNGAASDNSAEATMMQQLPRAVMQQHPQTDLYPMQISNLVRIIQI